MVITLSCKHKHCTAVETYFLCLLIGCWVMAVSAHMSAWRCCQSHPQSLLQRTWRVCGQESLGSPPASLTSPVEGTEVSRPLFASWASEWDSCPQAHQTPIGRGSRLGGSPMGDFIPSLSPSSDRREMSQEASASGVQVLPQLCSVEGLPRASGKGTNTPPHFKVFVPKGIN